MQGVCGGPQFQFNYIADRPPSSLVKGRWCRSAGGISACCRLLSFNHPVGAGHARPARFRKLLC